MNPTASISSETLAGLHEWCRAARDLFAGSHQHRDSPGLRALKHYLAERHAAHLRDLRQILYELGEAARLAAHPHPQHQPRFGYELQRALQSPDRATAIGACGAVEQQMALTYEQAARDPMQFVAPARALVDRHITEIESLRSFVRQIEAEQPGSRATVPANLVGT